jgi:hypothetical protein
VKISLVTKLRALLVFDRNHDSRDDPPRSSYERFAIPYTFKPQLTVVEAAISAAGAFLRIVSGSILFAVWGAYTLFAWNSIRNVLLRGGTVLALLLLFAVSFAGLMLAISALVRKCLSKAPRP